MTSLAKSTVAAIKMALDGLEFIHSHLGVGKGNNEKFLQASLNHLYRQSAFAFVIILCLVFMHNNP
jgi:hypothetical protein